MTATSFDELPKQSLSDETDDAPLHEGPAPRTDLELVSGLRDHDERAFTELYQRHNGSVRAAAALILGHGSACDDVVADVFLSFFCSPERFDPARGSLLGFLRLKAKGRSIDLLRAETSRARREENATTSGRESDVESMVLDSDRASAMQRAIAALPALEREALRLAYFGDMTYRQVAAYLGEAEGTVKSRIRKALQSLRVADNDLRLA